MGMSMWMLNIFLGWELTKSRPFFLTEKFGKMFPVSSSRAYDLVIFWSIKSIRRAFAFANLNRKNFRIAHFLSAIFGKLERRSDVLPDSVILVDEIIRTFGREELVYSRLWNGSILWLRKAGGFHSEFIPPKKPCEFVDAESTLRWNRVEHTLLTGSGLRGQTPGDIGQSVLSYLRVPFIFAPQKTAWKNRDPGFFVDEHCDAEEARFLVLTDTRRHFP